MVVVVVVVVANLQTRHSFARAIAKRTVETWLGLIVGDKILEWEMGVSKNRDTPKWMIYNGKPY